MVAACSDDPTASSDSIDGGTEAGSAFDAGVKTDAAGNTETYSVGGTVTGLKGTGLVLQNNAGDDLTVAADGSFTFAKKLAAGASFAVTIKNQPTAPSQTCTLTAQTGSVAKANVTSVVVNCTTSKFTVGGTVAGLTGAGLVLKVNGGDALPVAASGPFTFATPIESGAAYAITVDTQPANPNQTCVVMGGTGTVGAGNVTSVAVNCTTNKYTIGGTVSGIAGTAVLQNNGGNDLNVNANGTFAFSTPIESGAAYDVTIKTQPGVPSQTCTLASASGNVAAANVTSVVLTCVTNKFKVSANVTGLAGAGLVLQNKAGDDLSVAANGTFDFATTIASGQTYAVTVKTQPTGPSQTCTVTAPNGTVGAADVVVAVACQTSSFTVGGSITGLTAAGLVLQNKLVDPLSVAANAASFTFGTSVLSGSTYDVTVKTQPAGLTCVVGNGSGTVTNAAVTNITVACSAGFVKWSEGTMQWPDQACNPVNSFGGCDTNDQAQADAWATFVCKGNGFASGVWTGNKAGGCNGAISMWCGGQNIPCTPIYENFCSAGDQTKVEVKCF